MQCAELSSRVADEVCNTRPGLGYCSSIMLRLLSSRVADQVFDVRLLSGYCRSRRRWSTSELQSTTFRLRSSLGQGELLYERDRPCPVLRSRSRHSQYCDGVWSCDTEIAYGHAICGTEIAYGHAMCGTEIAYGHAMCGTEIAYAAPRWQPSA
eukprot:1466815-Rhodomonas_salina.4